VGPTVTVGVISITEVEELLQADKRKKQNKSTKIFVFIINDIKKPPLMMNDGFLANQKSLIWL